MAVGGYGMVQKLMVAQDRIGPFDPDMVLLTVYSSEEIRTITHMVNIVSSEIPIPFPFLQQIVERAGVTADMDPEEIRSRLEPFGAEIVDWTFRGFADLSRERGYKMIAVFIPAVRDVADGTRQNEVELLWKMAGQAGLDRLDLADVYSGHDLSDIELAPWDQHLGVFGNELVGERIYSELRNGYPLVFGESSQPPAAAATGLTGH